MEKEIIVFFIAMVVFIIITALILVIAYKRDRRFFYVHTKTGNRYRVIQECKMKYANKWMDAIAYASEKDGEIYVREYSDFVLNFKGLSEWEKSKK